jgi:hypothetical protein
MTTTSVHPLAERLLSGFRYETRVGTKEVHTIYSKTGLKVGEVCVGTTKVRLNFKRPLIGPPSTSIVLNGRDKSWPGKGCNITSANLEDARLLIAHVSDIHHAAV